MKRKINNKKREIQALIDECEKPVCCWYKKPLMKLLWVVGFGIAFGLVEAAVVIYIRYILQAGNWQPTSLGPSDVAFGIPYFAFLKNSTVPLIMPYGKIMEVEYWREAATILMLLSVNQLKVRSCS